MGPAGCRSLADRSHDATGPAPSSSSSSRRHMVDAGTGGACGRVLEWEVGLPAAGELTPVSHHLIPPALAAAFRIDLAGVLPTSVDAGLAYDSPTSHFSSRFDEDDGEDEGEGETEDAASGGGRGVRGGKKARMVWTPELHHRFVEAVEHLGDKGAVPKAIVRLMNVEGLTRENVASHLQKYRLYLKRTRTAATAATPPPPPPYFPRFGAQPRPDTANRSGCCAFVSCEKLGRE